MGRYADAVTNILLEQGRAKAQGALGSGQAWGQAVQQLGLIPSQMIQQRQQATQLQQQGELNQQQIASAKALAAQRQQEVTTAQKLTAQDTALRKYIADLGDADPDPKQVISIVGPERGMPIAQGFTALRKIQRDDYTNGQNELTKVMNGFRAATEAQRADAYPGIRETLITKGFIKPEDAPDTYDPAWYTTQVNRGLDAKTQAELAHIQAQTAKLERSEPIKLAPGEVAVSATGTEIARGLEKPAEHSAQYKEWQDYAAQGGPLKFPEYQTMDANRRATRVNAGGSSPDDIKLVVQGMMDGTLPPQLPGRASPAYNAIMAEAQRRGFNLATAATDWAATQKHVATMNGAQQLRLNQAVNALPEMLDSVESLAKQWDAGGFPALNRAQLALAKGGAFGEKAAKIANALDAQIADVVADLGNVYMGGNSPTDHALQLAGKSLQAEWSAPVLLRMVDLAKQNVKIRRHSIDNTGIAGASADNPYAPPAAPVPPPVVNAAPAPAAGVVRARDPQGVLHEAPAGTALPAGWTVER